VEWSWVTPTQCALDDGNGRYVRLIVVRGPYFNEADGTKYCVSGDGHEASVHSALEEAMKAAEASLSQSELDG